MPQTPAAVTLRQIMEQKYLAIFLNLDVWSDMRRLDFSPDIYVNLVYLTGANPVLAAGTTALTHYPRRLLPGATEVSYNPTAIAKLFTDAGLLPTTTTSPSRFGLTCPEALYL